MKIFLQDNILSYMNSILHFSVPINHIVCVFNSYFIIPEKILIGILGKLSFTLKKTNLLKNFQSLIFGLKYKDLVKIMAIITIDNFQKNYSKKIFMVHFHLLHLGPMYPSTQSLKH